MLLMVPGVSQEVPSGRSVARMVSKLVSVLQANQACTAACRTDGARRRVAPMLERRPAGSQPAGG